MPLDCRLCSDLCASSPPLFIGLSSVRTNGHRGLHLTTTHQVWSLEPTGGTEITLTHPKTKHARACSHAARALTRADTHADTPSERGASALLWPVISGRCQLSSSLFTSVVIQGVCHPHLGPEGSGWARLGTGARTTT